MFCKNAEWIGAGAEFSAPFLIKKFSVDSLRKAVIDICGLGYYELFLNGKRVGEEFFKPAVSDYSERDFSGFAYPLPDRTSHTVYYNSYDVTDYLRDGENTLAVLLGNGFYRQKKRVCEGNTWFGEELILRYDLRLSEKDGERRVYSDGTERALPSFITENNLFYGEEHDYEAFDCSLLRSGLAEYANCFVGGGERDKFLKTCIETRREKPCVRIFRGAVFAISRFSGTRRT